MKKVLISGGSGFVGNAITKVLEKDFDVYILTRSPDKLKHGKAILWENYDQSFDTKQLKDLYGVINLVGENISSKRWSDKQKKIILDSRVIGTKTIIDTLIQNKITPKKFVSTSGISIHGKTYLKKVSEDWESALISRNDLKSDKTILRVPVVLGASGGMIKEIRTLFKLGLGGTLGSGKQHMPWIHLEDLANLYKESLINDEYNGVIEAISPFVTTNKEFTEVLSGFIGKSNPFKVPKLALRVAVGEASTTFLEDIKIQDDFLTKKNFNFKYPTIENALKDIASKI